MLAVPAPVTGDERRHYYPLPDRALLDLGADLDDLTHELVPEDVAFAHPRQVTVDEMQIRPAGRGEPDSDDHVVGIDDGRVVDRLDREVVDPVPAQCPHIRTVRSGCR